MMYFYRKAAAADKAAGRNCGNCKHRAYYREGWYCVLQGYGKTPNEPVFFPSAKHDYVCDNFVRK